MNHRDHVQLIQQGIPAGSGVWADIGSGTGAFTLALRDVAGPEVEIWSVDQDEFALRAQRDQFARQFPLARLTTIRADFTRPLQLPRLDGILAANAIHFVRDQVTLLQLWQTYLKPGGNLVVVEYDTSQGNRWLPFPVSFTLLAGLAAQAGFDPPRLLAVRSSSWGGGMYAAALTVS